MTIPLMMAVLGGVFAPLAQHNRLPYLIESPDIIMLEIRGLPKKLPSESINGSHLVRPDGTISLGVYGSISVDGLTVDQAQQSVTKALKTYIKKKPFTLKLSIYSYNSKSFYVITSRDQAQQVSRHPLSGNETVLDAVALVPGLGEVAKLTIWLSRETTTSQRILLPVNWTEIVQQGVTKTNYQLLPGDRVYIGTSPAK